MLREETLSQDEKAVIEESLLVSAERYEDGANAVAKNTVSSLAPDIIVRLTEGMMGQAKTARELGARVRLASQVRLVRIDLG